VAVAAADRMSRVVRGRGRGRREGGQDVSGRSGAGPREEGVGRDINMKTGVSLWRTRVAVGEMRGLAVSATDES